jgi:hypothetical protein
MRDMQDMRQPDVMNHWTAPERVRTVGLTMVGENKVVLPALSVTALEAK